MSKRIILHVSMVLAFAMSITSQRAFAQEFSAEEREIWQFIEDCNDAYMDEDLNDILDCYHDDFSGWFYGDTVPRNKSTVEKFAPVDLETTEPLAYDLRPISIRVFGDFAVAHYFLRTDYRYANGEVLSDNNIWTDVLLREDGDWSWVADHGGPLSDQP